MAITIGMVRNVTTATVRRFLLVLMLACTGQVACRGLIIVMGAWWPNWRGRSVGVFKVVKQGDNVKVLTYEKSKVLAKRNGWSLAQAEGYIDGGNFRRRGITPSMYAQIGIDEYCLGFRAGYYHRQSPISIASFPGEAGVL